MGKNGQRRTQDMPVVGIHGAVEFGHLLRDSCISLIQTLDQVAHGARRQRFGTDRLQRGLNCAGQLGLAVIHTRQGANIIRAGGSPGASGPCGMTRAVQRLAQLGRECEK